jgi:hypothetical protein
VCATRKLLCKELASIFSELACMREEASGSATSKLPCARSKLECATSKLQGKELALILSELARMREEASGSATSKLLCFLHV